MIENETITVLTNHWFSLFLTEEGHSEEGHFPSEKETSPAPDRGGER